MVSLELVRQAKWLRRHILFRTVDCFLPFNKQPKELQESLIRDFQKKTDWYWSGKVIKVYVSVDQVNGEALWADVDWGYGFIIHDADEFSWPAGPWGAKGYLKMSDYEGE